MKKGFNFNPITDFTENVIISHHSSAQHIGRRLARQADMGCESSKEDEFQPLHRPFIHATQYHKYLIETKDSPRLT